LFRQREEWIRFSCSNKDTKDEERRKGLGRRQTTKCGATPEGHSWQSLAGRVTCREGHLPFSRRVFLSRRRASLRCASLTGVYFLGVYLLRVHLLQACCVHLLGVHLLRACILYRRACYRRASYRRESLTSVHVIGVHLLLACTSQAAAIRWKGMMPNCLISILPVYRDDTYGRRQTLPPCVPGDSTRRRHHLSYVPS
jgi:hypothetical protein